MIYRILEELSAKGTDQETMLIALSALNLAGILTALDRCEQGIHLPVQTSGAGSDTGNNFRRTDTVPAPNEQSAGRGFGSSFARSKMEERKERLRGGRESGAGKPLAGADSTRAAPRVIKWADWK